MPSNFVEGECASLAVLRISTSLFARLYTLHCSTHPDTSFFTDTFGTRLKDSEKLKRLRVITKKAPAASSIHTSPYNSGMHVVILPALHQ